MMDASERFLAKVRKTDGCWLWTGARNSAGYGLFHLEGSAVLAHRAVLALLGDAPPRDKLVCHRCDNPECVRPDHLFLGTNLDNARDKYAKGRQGPTLRGERNHFAKLTPRDVAAIRNRYASGSITQTQLGRAFGVHRGTISNIVNQRTWSPGSEERGAA